MPVNTILGLFAKSPIKPLQKHIVKVHQCSQQLVPFFDAVAEDRWEDAEKIRQQIAQLEKEADILKREIRLKLPRGLFLPVARTDLLELLTQQDKIANRAKDISGRMLGRKMEFPPRCVPISWPISNVVSMRPPKPKKPSENSMSCSKPALKDVKLKWLPR